MPNPTNILPMELSDEQRDAGFMIHFVNTASFDFIIGTLRGAGCCNGFFFAGKSNIRGECPDPPVNFPPSTPPPLPPVDSPMPPFAPDPPLLPPFPTFREDEPFACQCRGPGGCQCLPQSQPFDVDNTIRFEVHERFAAVRAPQPHANTVEAQEMRS